jgi:hypothetical protein
MPMHDWETVETGIYHAFHHEWISEISRALNRGLLPKSMYALPEQVAAGFGPDVLTLQGQYETEDPKLGGTATITPTKPKASHMARLIGGISQRRKSLIAVRHVTGDKVIAMIEIVSPGNKNSAHAFRTFVEKASELLEQRIHLLILDPFPPGPRDPNGIHAAIWDDISGESFTLPDDKPLTMVAYEVEYDINAYAETIAVGDQLPDMPLFLMPGSHILIPLEKTYMAAWDTVPRRWQKVIDPASVD